MARINAGSTLVNQYAPPFVVSDSVTDGWRLSWNSTLQAFEAIDPDANVVESGFDSIEVALYPDVTQQVFVVPWEAASKESIYVTIQGVKQHQDAYTVITNVGSGTTTVTLSEAVSNETVEILGLQASGGASINVFGPVNADADVPNTAQASFDLGWLAASRQSLLVSIDGTKQNTSAYSITPNANATDTTLTFSESPSMSITTPIAIIDGGTGYSVGNILTLTGGTFTTAATLTVTSEAGGIITGVSINNAGVYTVFPTGTLTSTGAGNSDATFTVTKDSQRIEVIGIQTAGETPASPVNVVSAYGLDTATAFSPFASKTLSGDEQILSFKALEAGTNITIADNTNRLTITAVNPVFAETTAGGGTSLFDTGAIDQDAPTFRKLIAGDRVALSVAGADNPIAIAYNFGYVSSGAATINVGDAERLVNVLPGAATTVNLPAIANVPAGDTITVKDANGTALTNNITIETAAAETIDGAANYVINTARGYVTVYSDGANFHIIAEG